MLTCVGEAMDERRRNLRAAVIVAIVVTLDAYI